ncbi:hypothetical protein HBB16_19455 [Pseudonocardia sp. MCCB 268]|nr:hypothetical protein [Pseudonocardia cytotoxica]
MLRGRSTFSPRADAIPMGEQLERDDRGDRAQDVGTAGVAATVGKQRRLVVVFVGDQNRVRATGLDPGRW